MARITPDPRRTGKPAFDPPCQQRPIGHGPFKCRYCGRYGQPGACAGCGAPNAPVEHKLPPRRPDQILRYHEVGGPNRIDVTVFSDKKSRYIDTYPNPVPSFDMVKR